LKSKLSFLALSLLLLFSFNTIGQTFKRIENIVGFKDLRENNGVAVADYDGDYDLDLFIVAKSKDKDGVSKSHSRLFRNENNGKFIDVTEVSGLNNLHQLDNKDPNFLGLDGVKYGVFWGDYNNDGYPDLFLTNLHRVQLFKNNTNGTFEDVTEQAGITKENGCNNTGATWFDYNNDGYLDLFINDWKGCGKNSFYKNKGDGTFESLSNNSTKKWAEKRASYVMMPFDFNKNGYKDLYISYDLRDSNDLFINDNTSVFENKASSYLLNSAIDDMSITVNDFDNDGEFDFFITGIEENRLFKKTVNNTYSDVAKSNELFSTNWSWASIFSDFDLDGDEDLIISNGSPLHNASKNTFYKNLHIEGGNKFLESTEEIPFDNETLSMEVIDFDYDNDGDLDVFSTNLEGPPNFLENRTNNSKENSEYNWVKLYLEGTVSNKNGLGSIIEVTTQNGIYKRYHTGIGLLSQSLKPIHFGLNSNNSIVQIKITWPTGVSEIYKELALNSHIKLIENGGAQVLNLASSIKIIGCTDPNSCNFNPLATESDDSCQYLPSKEILGSSNSSFNKEETYSYDIHSGSTVIWEVEGGAISHGQNSGQVTVKWGIEKNGVVSIIEKNNQCTSSKVEKKINLDITESENNISIARVWNEALLEAIRKDFARPTVHARNLFHSAIAAYDSWAIYDKKAQTYLLGNTINEFKSEFHNFIPSEEIEIARNKTISFALYRLLTHRFKNSPGATKSLERFDLIMEQFEYDTNFTSKYYQDGDAAALGNFIAQTIINYGLIDGSNEINDYRNKFYEPKNKALNLHSINKEIEISDPNRWQPLTFNTFIDQSGNHIAGETPQFLSPEWGKVFPFSLKKTDKQNLTRDNSEFTVYHLPETPPQLDTLNITESSNLYKWNFALVSQWSSHLDPTDQVMIDISPASIGNIPIDEIPIKYEAYKNFYKDSKGGDISYGHKTNPITSKPYTTQYVPRADYARVLAEFWADGPDSETPPGHWFTILNYVNDHPEFIKKFNGKGAVLETLEWDVKAYLILAGAMHDSAITAWGIKGWIDYVRPISAIRYMSKLGQSTDENLDNYHVGGIPLIDGYIELIKAADPLVGTNNKNLGDIKVLAWRGHDYIDNPKTDVAGVDWILAKNWWPYQRPSFVTPPFAGFISGHSTFSRAAAEVMTLITGDEFFPGGMGEFIAKKNNFLVFEKGPSVDVKLQWATYRDASDQTSLSRIWGGIHPPADDLHGRIIGEKIGIDAFYFATSYFTSSISNDRKFNIFPNPTTTHTISISNTLNDDKIQLFTVNGKKIELEKTQYKQLKKITEIKISENTSQGFYILKVNNKSQPLVISN
jgi:hypothetical protein